MDKGERFWLFALLAFALLIRIPFLAVQPLVLDEALYARMIDETIATPAVIPHFLGQEVAWRPPLFFDVYAPLVKIGLGAGLQLEVAYRLPSVLFGALSVLLLYFFARKLWGRDIAFAASLFFAASGLAIYVNATVLTDTLLVFLILLSLNFYILGEKERKLLLVAELFAACAFLVKTIVAFAIPVLAVAYFFSRKREMLADPYFIASLLMVAAAFLLYFAAFGDKSAIMDEYLHNVTQKLPTASVNDIILRVLQSAVPFIFLSFYMTGFYIWGAWLLRKDIFVIAWLALGIFALFGGSWMPWYFLPMMPALSICAAKFLSKDGLDSFAKAVIGISVVVMILTTYFLYAYDFGAGGEREAGLYVHGKSNVLIAGAYAPSAVFYKIHGEEGLPLPCWEIAGSGQLLNSSEYALSVLRNYSGAPNRRLTDIFWNREEFSLSCNASAFDYIVLKEANYSGLLAAGYSIDKRIGGNIVILKLKNKS